MTRGRGRPKGSGRWGDFQDYRLWARITEIREAEGLNVRDACNALAHRGLWQAKNGRYWLSNPATVHKDARIVSAIDGLVPGDIRNEDPAEQFRARFYAAERRRKADASFRESCDLWLAYHRRYRELRDAGTDPDAASWEAFKDACATRA